MAIKQPLRLQSKTLTIIPQSGIQFLDFRLNSKGDRFARTWSCYDATKKGEKPQPGDFALTHRDDAPVNRDTASLPVKYSIGRREVFEMFENRWMPIPLFRRVGDGFFRGPTNWARVRLMALPTADEDGNDYHLVMALDTNLMEAVEGRP